MAVKHCVEPISINDPKWLTGFHTAIGFISINKSKTTLGYAIQ